MEMTRCYPTGCAPCDGPIDFPENPTDGQRFCIPIGSEGNTKCWVWDACVPAWRAEGPSESSTRFRGSLNITISEAANGITHDTPFDQWQGNPPQPPVTDVAPGDWWILTDDVDAASVHPDFNNNLSGSNYLIGDRIFYDGEAYERLAPPIVPFAEEAVDVNPNPDNRVGGITLNASLQDALIGTKKCDAITPYTLSKYVAEEISKLPPPPVVNDGQLTIKYGSTVLDTFTANQAGNTTCTIPTPPVPPTVNNGQLTIRQGATTLGTFTANQATNGVINIPEPPTAPIVGSGRIRILQNGVQWGDFYLNQSLNEDVILPNISNAAITLRRNGVTLGSFTLNQGANETFDINDSAPTAYGAVGTYSMYEDQADRGVGSVFNGPTFGLPAGTWRRMGVILVPDTSIDDKKYCYLVVRVS